MECYPLDTESYANLPIAGDLKTFGLAKGMYSSAPDLAKMAPVSEPSLKPQTVKLKVTGYITISYSCKYAMSLIKY